MGRANNKNLYTTPNLNDELFGFKANGEDVNIPIESIKSLIESSITGFTNYFSLGVSPISDGTFTSNSLDFEEVNSLEFNNIDSRGVDLKDYFQLLSDNKEDVFLKITEVGFEVNAIFRILNVTFNTNTTSFEVSLYNSLSRGSLKVEGEYSLDLSIENYQPDYNQEDSTKGDYIKNKPTSFPLSFIEGLQEVITGINNSLTGTSEIDLSLLETGNKDSLKDAINELNSNNDALETQVDTNISDIVGLQDSVDSIASGLVYSIPQSGNTPTTEPAPTEDGMYVVTESGTYTNFGGEVVDISGQLVYIFVSGNQTVFTQVEISINTVILQNLFNNLNDTDGATMKAISDYLDLSFSDIFSRETFVSDVDLSPTWQNEANVFSGWGWGVGVRDSFNAIKINIREDDSANPITNITVRVRENNKSGSILGEVQTLFSNVQNEELTVQFNSIINNSNPLWVEFLTDGYTGWFGQKNTVNGTQIMYYNTNKLTSGELTTAFSGGGDSQAKTEFLIISDKYSFNDSVITTLKEDLGINDINDLFFQSFNFSTESSVITPVFTNGQSFGSPFSGWGADFNKDNVTFNALKLKQINRNTVSESEKWQYIKVFVKNDKSDSTNLATSDFITIDKESNTIDEVLIPLIDSNNAFISLNDSSFSGSTYFIGYIFYNENYEVAYGGVTKGTQSNFAGNSYYTTGVNSSSWSNYSGNPTIPFEHLFLSDLSLTTDLIENVDIKERITQLETDILIKPRIILPDSIDVALGYTRQLFYNAIIESLNLENYNIKVTGNVGGKQYPRYYEFTPNSVGTFTFTIGIYDLNDNLIISDSCNIVVTALATSPATSKKVLCVGDSLTSGGIWTGELQRMLAQSGGVPTGLNLSNIDFIGTVGSGDNLYEGYGGKTWNWYINETTDADVTFYVTSHDKHSADILSIYEDDNSNQWKLESITSPTELVFSRVNHILPPPSSGDLTYVSGGVNTSTIVYNSIAVEAFNKFWNTTTNELDFTNYVTENSFSAIDYVCVLLTWNGMGGGKSLASDHLDLIDDAKVFIDKMHSQYPTAKIKLMGIQFPSINGGLAFNYGDSSSPYGNYFELVKTVNGLNLAYQDLANESAYNSFVEFVNVSAQFDNVNNMPQTQKDVNLRNSNTETVGTNGVHPVNSGYYQIADAIFNNINKEF